MLCQSCLTGPMQNQPKNAPTEEALDKEATHTLAEMRMVLPGVQALFGFQLVAVFNQPFAQLLAAGEQRLHLLGLTLTAVTVAVTMAPAAYQRQAEPHQITRRFLTLTSRMLSVGMFTLMLSLLLDCYLIAWIILRQKVVSVLITLTLGLLYVGLWFVFPRLMKRHLQKPLFGQNQRRNR